MTSPGRDADDDAAADDDAGRNREIIRPEEGHEAARAEAEALERHSEPAKDDQGVTGTDPR